MTIATDRANQIIKENTDLDDLGLSIINEITDRRGAAVVKLSDKQNNLYALKFKVPDRYDQSEIIKCETKILKKLSNISNNLYCNSGKDWLLTHWIDGQNVSNICSSLRDQEFSNEVKERFVDIFKQIIRKVISIHEAGYIHGDLQPSNFIMTKNEAVLLDWGFAHKETDKEFKYIGALIHFTSPEVAREMRAKKKYLEHDMLSEVYMLCSVLFVLFTGKTSTFYGSYDYKNIPMGKKLEKIISGNVHSFEQAGASDYPELEEVLKWGLALNREDRCPSAQDLYDAFEKLGSLYDTEN